MAEHTPHEHEQHEQHEHHPASDHDHGHHHGHGLDPHSIEWAALAAHVELEGELLRSMVRDTADRIAGLRAAGTSMRHILDIGSGPGVAACELADRFPDAAVVALDSSAEMLTRAAARAGRLGLAARVSTLAAELPGGIDEVRWGDGATAAGTTDLIWGSMVLHHVGDEVACLRALGNALAADGFVAIAEFGDPTQLLPDDLPFAPPGLTQRLDAASTAWVATMRAGLDDATSSDELPAMFVAAGLEVVDDRIVHHRVAPPLPDAVRSVVLGHVRRMRVQLADRLDAQDLAALDVLADVNDERGVMRRADARFDVSRRILIARRSDR